MDAVGDGEGDLLGYLQRSAREGTLLASCDRDVVEFMHQLDVLISAKQAEWERKESALRDLLQTRERDLSGLRLAMQEREKEVSTLKEAVSLSQGQNMDGQSVYAKQVDKLKAELQRLSHNYEKLRSKKRHTGGGRAVTSSGPASQEAHARSSEVARLKDQRDLLELRLREVEQEKGRVDSHLLASRNEIAALQGRCLSLQEKLESSRQEQEQLRREKQTAAEVHAQASRELEEKLDQTLHLLDGRESLVRSLREEQEGAACRAEASEAELRQLNERVCGLQEGLHRVERQRCDLRQQLKLKEESLQALTAENQRLSSALLEVEQNAHSSSAHCSRSLRGEEEEEGVIKHTAEMRKECERLRRKAVVYKQECSNLRAQLSAALVQGEVVRESQEVDPQLERTVTELTTKLRSLEENWREEREKLLEENKRLEAVGQQRNQELQMTLHQLHQLERELDAMKKELAESQKQLQAVLKDGVQIPHELGGSHVAPSASPGSSGKAAHMRGAVPSTGGSSPQLRPGQRSTEEVSQQGDGALLRTLDAILSKHFSQINAKLSSNEDT